MEFTEKKALLERTIARKGPMLVAFSGGVDSGLLCVLAHRLSAGTGRCVLLDSPLVPRETVRYAADVAKAFHLSLEVVPFPFGSSAAFLKNPPDRCYHCRKIASQVLKRRAEELHLACVADGLNVSDLGEHRPGTRAADEEGIVHPFVEAGITKEDIRAIARDLGLPFWDRPADSCLATRIPHGVPITEGNLAMVGSAEAFLRRLGVRQVRVRFHGNSARIEADEEGMATIFARKDDVLKECRQIGFLSATLDLAGYRSGDTDEAAWR